MPRLSNIITQGEVILLLYLYEEDYPELHLELELLGQDFKKKTKHVEISIYGFTP